MHLSLSVSLSLSPSLSIYLFSCVCVCVCVRACARVRVLCEAKLANPDLEGAIRLWMKPVTKAVDDCFKLWDLRASNSLFPSIFHPCASTFLFLNYVPQCFFMLICLLLVVFSDWSFILEFFYWCMLLFNSVDTRLC